jgi:DNA polymerase-3 subunit delta
VTTPVVYLFHGDDEYQIAQEIDGLKAKLGDDAMVELNTTYLEGKSLSLEELRGAATTIPFLARRRLVIVTDPVITQISRGVREQFVHLLEDLPPQSALVLHIPRSLKGNHWLIRWVQENPERGYVRAFSLPEGARMSRWIQNRARAKGGTFSPQASAYLASLIGNDTRTADQEVEKMLAYVNFERPVAVDDVQHLFAPIELDDPYQVFDMVDALGNQQGERAIKDLHQLLQVRDPGYVFVMIVRQYRLLLQAREIIDQGGDHEDIRERLELHPFVAGKVTQQAQNYDQATLDAIYQVLLDLDGRMKTGQVESVTALHTLTASLTTPGRPTR